MAAIGYCNTVARSRTERNLSSLSSGDDLIAAIVADCKDYYFSDSFDVAMDISKSVSHDEAMQRDIGDAIRHYRAYAEGGWIRHLTDRGWEESDARDLIDMTTSMVRGFAVRAWLQPDKTIFDRLIQRWSEIAAQHFPPKSADRME